jgi:hypothetical protein
LSGVSISTSIERRSISGGRHGCLLVPLARIPKRLRFYEDAAKVVQRRMVPNFKKSFERAVRTARR